uniref:Uncharacterized protein n=1 Tax=Romanomermis culicivorax TaxID=13658 RepID=A0A915JIL0_ROMCU
MNVLQKKSFNKRKVVGIETYKIVPQKKVDLAKNTLEVYTTVAVRIGGADHGVKFGVGQFFAQTFHHVAQFFRRYVAVFVAVIFAKFLEGQFFGQTDHTIFRRLGTVLLRTLTPCWAKDSTTRAAICWKICIIQIVLGNDRYSGLFKDPIQLAPTTSVLPGGDFKLNTSSELMPNSEPGI